MTDQRQPESADHVEDLDVPAAEGDQIKGGIQDGTSNTIMVGEVVAKPSSTLQKHCAAGKHFPDAQIT